jgi:VWFA-related protein
LGSSSIRVSANAGDEQRASFQFLDKVLREGTDRAFVFRFDFDVEMLQDVTSSRQKLKDSLAVLELPSLAGPGRRTSSRRGAGGTTLFDAVLLGSNEVMRHQKGRKALLVLSDGVDTGSKMKVTDAIEMAQRSDTLVYGILYEDRDLYRRPGIIGWGGRQGRAPRVLSIPNGSKVLQRMAEETGGGYFEVSKKRVIGEVFARIEDQLRHQYSLGFKSDGGSAPGFRKLSLTVKPKGLTVTARNGYWAGEKSVQ